MLFKTFSLVFIIKLLLLIEPLSLFSYSPLDTIYSDGKKLACDFGRIGCNLYESKTDIFAGALALGVISYSASYFDDALNPSSNDRRTITPLKQLGELRTGIGLPVSLYCIGLLLDNTELRTASVELSEAIALAAMVNFSLKYSIGRARPFMDKGTSDFQYFEAGNDYQSFPSGHTTLAFTISSYFAGKIDTWWSYPLFYSAALLTGYERIQSGNHWFSDVVCGAAIGVFSSYSVLNLSKKRISLSIIPYINTNSNSIGIIYKF